MTQTRGINPSVPPSGDGCLECLATDGWWYHLRRCAECGHFGSTGSSGAADQPLQPIIKQPERQDDGGFGLRRRVRHPTWDGGHQPLPRRIGCFAQRLTDQR